MRACARLFPRRVGVCVRHTRDRPKNRSCSPFGSSHLKGEAEFVALLRGEKELRLREARPPRRAASDFIAHNCSLFCAQVTTPTGFCKLRKVFVCFFSPSQPEKTPAAEAGCGESCCPSLEAGCPGTNTATGRETDRPRGEGRQTPCLCDRKVLLIMFTIISFILSAFSRNATLTHHFAFWLIFLTPKR